MEAAAITAYVDGRESEILRILIFVSGVFVEEFWRSYVVVQFRRRLMEKVVLLRKKRRTSSFCQSKCLYLEEWRL